MKTRLIRAWSDLAPKLIAFLGTSAAVTGLIALLASFGIVLDPVTAAAVVAILGSVVGYLVPDKVALPLQPEGDGESVTPSA
jgi:flagellar motor component MotA